VWPHSISIGVGGKAISIDTDDADIAAALEPWRILAVGGPTDYCLELHPEGAAGAKTRPLPGLYHGSQTVLRSRDPARLTAAFLRVLGSHAWPAGPDQVRIGLMPVIVDGVAVLAPLSSIGAVPDRWIRSKGIDVRYTVSSLVDVDRGQVLLDPPLGSDDDPETRTFAGWWLPQSRFEGRFSPGFAVAEAMTLVTDVTTDTAASVLQAVASLVERSHPVVAPKDSETVKELLSGITGNPGINSPP
jgi:hypothetical protein